MANETMRVLVVDDDATMRRIVKTLLLQIGYKNVAEACDGQVALEMLEQDPTVGLILCDWDMPRMDGLTFLTYVRNNERYIELPFIMVTAQDSKDRIITAAKAKVSQYIIKPFTAQSLREKIDKVLRKDQAAA